MPDIAFDRLSEHYRPDVGLAQPILRSESFERSLGGTRARACLLGMSRVFDDSVVAALK
jgi:hypothetical protein